MRNYIITSSSLTIVIGNKPYIIDKTHTNFDRIKDAIKTNASDEYIISLIDVATHINEYAQGKVLVKDGVVTYKGIDIRNALTSRILTMVNEGFNIDGMCLFMENLYNNPSKTAVDELYLFLEACNLPITEDGYFLAYKKVRPNYMDIHSGTFDNSIGQKPQMDRNMVDDNRNNTCSQGLHFASYSYMSSFGNNTTDKIMILKINPADVVSIPSDYDNAKGRCWQYEVIGEVPNDGKTQIKKDCIKNSEFSSKNTTKKTAHPFKNVKEVVAKALYSGKITTDIILEMFSKKYGTLLDLSYENNNQFATNVRDKAYEMRAKYNSIDKEIVDFVKTNSTAKIVGVSESQPIKTIFPFGVIVNEQLSVDVPVTKKVVRRNNEKIAKQISKDWYSGLYTVKDVCSLLTETVIYEDLVDAIERGENYNKLSKTLEKLCYTFDIDLEPIQKNAKLSADYTEKSYSYLSPSERIDVIKNGLMKRYEELFGPTDKSLLVMTSNTDLRKSIETQKAIWGTIEVKPKYNNIDINKKLDIIETKLKKLHSELWLQVENTLPEGITMRKENNYKAVIKSLRKLAENGQIDLDDWVK